MGRSVPGFPPPQGITPGVSLLPTSAYLGTHRPNLVFRGLYGAIMHCKPDSRHFGRGSPSPQIWVAFDQMGVEHSPSSTSPEDC